MKFQFLKNLDLPIVVIDNFYSEESCKNIWQELCFLNNSFKLLSPDSTGSAIDLKTNLPLKNNLGISLDEAYANRNVSNILKENRKVFLDEFTDRLVEYSVFFRYLRAANIDTTLVQYYENSDYYKFHTDDSTITIISWFYERPKKFSGGNLIFENNLTINCEYNRTVIFPSILFHSVEEILMDSESQNKNYGRYSITQLVSIT